MKRSASVANACPCGSGVDYAACCGRYIDHWEAPAPDAERLMRSRYTAFVRERRDYLLATWHLNTCPEDLAFEHGCQWLGLEVRDVVTYGEAAADVEFVARYRIHGRAVRLHERSHFVMEDGRWYYVDGE